MRWLSASVQALTLLLNQTANINKKNKHFFKNTHSPYLILYHYFTPRIICVSKQPLSIRQWLISFLSFLTLLNKRPNLDLRPKWLPIGYISALDEPYKAITSSPT